ncbi:MAG: GGDEF domain-containing protein [Parasphingorhabdus sp.]|nr:GGDEF domain-containing protein [Parasphingorhabdus sp.]
MSATKPVLNQPLSARVAAAAALLTGRQTPAATIADNVIPLRPFRGPERLLDFLDDHHLDPLPEHYQLAWEYFHGTSLGLRSAVDTAIATHGRLTRPMVQYLLAEHLSVMSAERLKKLVSDSDRMIGKGQDILRNSQNDSREFSAALQERIDYLDAGPQDRDEQFSAMLQLTKIMAMQAFSAQQQLQSASEQLSDMRNKLNSATEKAEQDQLTGLPNRWAFEKRLSAALVQARENVEPLTVAFIDVDNFKLVNDMHGHEAGDRVLRRIAKELSSLAGDVCHVARHGGEEFVLLFSDRDCDAAFAIVDEARERLAELDLSNRETGRKIGTISFSAGISSLAGDGDARAMLRRADAALYEAKDAGRNCVHIRDHRKA